MGNAASRQGSKRRRAPSARAAVGGRRRLRSCLPHAYGAAALPAEQEQRKARSGNRNRGPGALCRPRAVATRWFVPPARRPHSQTQATTHLAAIVQHQAGGVLLKYAILRLGLLGRRLRHRDHPHYPGCWQRPGAPRCAGAGFVFGGCPAAAEGWHKHWHNVSGRRAEHPVKRKGLQRPAGRAAAPPRWRQLAGAGSFAGLAMAISWP